MSTFHCILTHSVGSVTTLDRQQAQSKQAKHAHHNVNISPYSESFNWFSNSPVKKPSTVKTGWTCTPRFTILWITQLIQRQPWKETKRCQNRLNMSTTMSMFHHTLNQSSTALDRDQVQSKPAKHAHHHIKAAKRTTNSSYSCPSQQAPDSQNSWLNLQLVSQHPF